MNLLEPIYKESGKTYRIDTCRPQIEAMNAGKIRLVALTRGHYPGRKLPETELAGITSLGYWDAVVKQDWGLETHRNEGIEISFIETGGIVFTVEDTKYDLHPGDFTITRPWQAHNLGDPNIRPGRLHWLILDVQVRRPNQPWKWPDWVVLTRHDLDELTRILRGNESPVWPSTPEIRQCFRKIAAAVDRNQDNSHISHLIIYLNELFLQLLETFRSKGITENPALSSTQRTVQLFLNDLNASTTHLAHTWTLEEMAHHCGLGVTAFVKYCRQLTNTTPVEYLNQCRVEEAARLLIEHPGMKITDVAFHCGFYSSQYFATVFRHHYHCSPRTYRVAHIPGVPPPHFSA